MCKPDKQKPADSGFDEPHLAAGAVCPAITWHSGLTSVLPGRLWTVSGATKVEGKINFPATMTVIKDGASLVLVNSLRFPDELNAEILALAGSDGAPVHVVRLGSYHGGYDSFWKKELGERGRLWTLAGHKMQEGLVADETLSKANLPLQGVVLFEFALGKPEAALVLRQERFAVFCDTVCNINSFQFVSWYAAPVIWAMGYRSAVNRNDKTFNRWMTGMVGKDKVRKEYERVLENCDFDSYSSGHGPAMVGGAREKIREAMKARLG